jgi:hypothetical protein
LNCSNKSFNFQSFFWHQGWLKGSALFSSVLALLHSHRGNKFARQRILGSGKLICRGLTVLHLHCSANLLQFGRFVHLLFIVANGFSSLVLSPTLWSVQSHLSRLLPRQTQSNLMQRLF